MVICVAVGVLTACVPKFAPGASLAVVPYGSALRVEWPEATDPDGLAIESYRVDVDGVEVARRPASVERCDLAGLTPGDHEIVVTAFDAAGEWSGAADVDGQVASIATATAAPPEGAEPACAPVGSTISVDDGTTGVTSNVVTTADGSVAVVTSTSADLAGGDLNGQPDVFMIDRTTGAATRIAEGISYAGLIPDISATGRFVAFESRSSLVPEDTDPRNDVYVWDRADSSFTVVSTGNGRTASETLHMSDDGRFVAYGTTASNLDPTDTNGQGDVYLWDRAEETSTKVSAPSVSQSFPRAMTPDGRFVVYTNLGLQRLYLWDRVTGTTTSITPGYGLTTWASISDDGKTVAFSDDSRFLVPGDSDTNPDVFLWDRDASATTRVTPGTEWSLYPQISGDGRYVTFMSRVPDLVPDDTNGVRGDLFVLDRRSGSITRLSDRVGSVSSVSADGGVGWWVQDATPAGGPATTNLEIWERVGS